MIKGLVSTFYGDKESISLLSSSNSMHELYPRRRKRQRTEKSFELDFLTIFLVESSDKIANQFRCTYLIDENSKTYRRP